jgi:hypothetical protein
MDKKELQKMAPALLAAIEALYMEFEQTMVAEYVTWEPDATGYPAALEAKRLIELAKQ